MKRKKVKKSFRKSKDHYVETPEVIGVSVNGGMLMRFFYANRPPSANCQQCKPSPMCVCPNSQDISYICATITDKTLFGKSPEELN